MMKKLSIGLAISLSLVACKKKKESENKEPVGSSAPMVQETGSAAMAGSGSAAAAAEAPLTGKDLADKYIKCTALVSDNKLDDFASQCIAAEYVGHMIDSGQDLKGPDAIKQQFQMVRGSFSDLKLSPQLVLVNGRNILAVELVQGTNDGTLKFPGMPETPATKKKIGYLLFHRIQINDQNKATEEWAYEDPTQMMGQLGLIPKGGPATRPAMDKGWDGAPNIVVAADNDTEKKNLEVSKALDAAFNARKVPEMIAMLSDDFVESDQADDKDAKGKKDAEAGIKMFQTAFSDVKLTADNAWAAGDYVVELGALDGTNDHDAGPMKKTGKKVNLHYAELLKLKDGKVTNLWRFRNGVAMAMQLGLMPGPGAGAGSAAAGSAAAGSAAPKK